VRIVEDEEERQKKREKRGSYRRGIQNRRANGPITPTTMECHLTVSPSSCSEGLIGLWQN
jgi:hypothetical protein